MAEHQVNTETTKHQAPPAEDISNNRTDSRADERNPALEKVGGIDVMGELLILKAMGDSLVCIHAAQTYGNVDPFDNTIQTIGYLIIEKTKDIAEALGIDPELN